MEPNLAKICSDLIKGLPSRQKEVISRRFGLESGERETLESIGGSHNVTRERIRQIQNDAISGLKPGLKKYEKISQRFIEQIRTTGDLREEEDLLNSLGGQKFQNQAFFLLTLDDSFSRFQENDDYRSLWLIKPDSLNFAKEVINSFYNILCKKERPLTVEDLSPAQIFRKKMESATINRLSRQAFVSYIGISKKIQQNQDGLIGLKNWPEINPRGMKDKAFLVFKKENKPLHFTQVATLIGPAALPQTVHNELIKDSRFVLVGRGLYALKEWGYEEGQVKDVILKILKESRKPLKREEIMEKVLKQRIVKESTILLNLCNKKYFLRDSQGKYRVNPVRKGGILDKTTLS